MLVSKRLGGFGFGVCKCGHLQSDHSNSVAPIGQDGKKWLEHNHGGCCAGHCDCKRFTFARIATLDEVADMVIAKRIACT